MAPIRSITVLAAVALLVGVACAADNQVESFKGLFPKSITRATKDALAGMTLGKAMQLHANRGRALAEMSTCQTLLKQEECLVVKTKEACGETVSTGASGCKWDDWENSCEFDEGDQSESEAMGSLLVASLSLMGSVSTCQAHTSSSECGLGCAWVESRTPKCSINQESLTNTMTLVTDPTMKDVLALQWKCGMIIGDDKNACDAEQFCEYKTAAATNSTSGRKLLGSDDSTGNTCEPTTLGNAVVMKSACPAEYNTMKGKATTDEEKKIFADADASTYVSPSASGATTTSMVAAAVVAAAVALLAL